MLQISVTLENPMHSFPPKDASTVGDRLLILVPPPQSSEHSPTCHSPQMQSTNNKIFEIKMKQFFFF